MRGEAWQANVCSHSRCWLAGSYEDLQGPLQSMDEDHPSSVGSIDGGVLCPSANVLHRAATRSRGRCFFRWRGSRCGGATHLFTIEQACVFVENRVRPAVDDLSTLRPSWPNIRSRTSLASLWCKNVGWAAYSIDYEQVGLCAYRVKSLELTLHRERQHATELAAEGRARREARLVMDGPPAKNERWMVQVAKGTSQASTTILPMLQQFCQVMI